MQAAKGLLTRMLTTQLCHLVAIPLLAYYFLMNEPFLALEGSW